MRSDMWTRKHETERLLMPVTSWCMDSAKCIPIISPSIHSTETVPVLARFFTYKVWSKTIAVLPTIILEPGPPLFLASLTVSIILVISRMSPPRLPLLKVLCTPAGNCCLLFHFSRSSKGLSSSSSSRNGTPLNFSRNLSPVVIWGSTK